MWPFSKASPKAPSAPQSTTPPPAYKCLSCGAPLKGMVLYCEGCSGYVCRSCAIPASDDDVNQYDCPNCSTRLSFFTLPG